MYNQKIMERFASQKYLGEIRSANATGSYGDPALGDIIKFYFVVEDGIITEAKAKVFGCVAAFAVASVVCQKIQGRSIEQALEFDMNDVNTELDGVPTEKGDVLETAKHAIVEAINNYFKKLEKESA